MDNLANEHGRSKWRRVSLKSPCPICGKPDWCIVSADGAVVGCMRIENGAFKTKTGRSGQTFFLHRLNGQPRADITRPESAGQVPELADIETRHGVYSTLLAALFLTASHRDQLRQRGLSDVEIDRRGYSSLPKRGRSRVTRELRSRFGDVLLCVPGFVFKEREGQRYLTIAGAVGLLVPVRDLAGRIIALKVRRDDDHDGPRYSYISSAKQGGPSPGSPSHVPLGVTAPAATVRLTEGELKADVATALSSIPTISAPGVASWRPCLDVLRALDAKTVRLAFDADASDKPAVARPLMDCAEALSVAGYALELERWHATDGKGIDDVLAAGNSPEVVAGPEAMAAVRAVAGRNTASRASAAGSSTADGIVYQVKALTVTVAKMRTKWRITVARGDEFLGVNVVNVADVKGRRELLKCLSDAEDDELGDLESFLVRLTVHIEHDWQQHEVWVLRQQVAQLQQQHQQAAAEEAAAREARLQEIQPVAFRVLDDQALLWRVGKAVAARGIIGERANALILCLAILSQITAKPISVVVKGDSSGGKSFLVLQITFLFPSDWHIDFTSMSERALIYDQRGYSHKTIVIFEVHGEGGELGSYIIRSLISEGCIRHQTVESTPQGLVGRQIVKEGPTNFITTTTHPKLHDENETRLWTILVDDSPETTKKVLQIQAQIAAGTFQPAEHADLRLGFEWLKAAGATEAVVPFASLLAEAMPEKPLRLRRDFPRLLQLIQVCAILHQRRRQRDASGRVVAALGDYGMIRELIGEVFARTVAGLTEKTRELVEALERVLARKVQNGTQADEAQASHSDLVAETGRSKSYISKWLHPALQLGLVDNTNPGKGKTAALKMGKYKLDEGDVLPTVQELTNKFGIAAEWVSPITGKHQLTKPFSTVSEPFTNGCSPSEVPQSPKGQGVAPSGAAANRTVHAFSEQESPSTLSDRAAGPKSGENKGRASAGKNGNASDATAEVIDNVDLTTGEPFVNGSETVENGFEEGAL